MVRAADAFTEVAGGPLIARAPPARIVERPACPGRNTYSRRRFAIETYAVPLIDEAEFVVRDRTNGPVVSGVRELGYSRRCFAIETQADAPHYRRRKSGRSRIGSRAVSVG